MGTTNNNTTESMFEAVEEDTGPDETELESVEGGDPVDTDDGTTTFEDESGVSLNEQDLFTPNSIISASNDYELHDNVARDLVQYVRSNTIRNEEQFLLLTFAYVSGLSDDPHDYVSSVAIGTSSSGKTHVKGQVDTLCRHLEVMDASTGSDKSLVYDEEWGLSDIISMGELNQPSDEMIEFMKRAHGGDEEVVIRSTRGNPSEGFETKKIVKKARSYHFSYAQMDADFEFWNRLLKVPVHESESKNRAVGRMAFGHGDIDLGDDAEYGFRFDDGTERLQAHVLDVKRHAPGTTILPNGSEDFDWDIWEIVEPIFNHSRSESNRVYQMISNLVKASARVNYQARETVEYTERVRNDNGGTETITKEAAIAEPQDVANVMRCLETLRSTTHEIGPRKRAVVEAIKTKGEDDTVEGLEPIVEFLEESDASEVKQAEIEVILDDLEDNHLITVDGDEITARNWDELGEPRIEQHADLFEDCVDPITGDDFLESWQEYRQEAITTGSDLLDDTEIESSGTSISSAEPETTVAETAEAMDMPDWKAQIVNRISCTLDETRVSDMQQLPVEAFIGLTSPREPDMASVESKGTMLDPEHAVWDVDDKPDAWVSSETDARKQIQRTISELVQQDVIRVAEVHTEENGRPVDVTLSVEV